ncbi:hypothetical protein [Marinoscillum pacificum]|uniref:hypothetical protein n=1 Tax=Marinoscillum pacificum TaxID=392723 RepID=UPI002157EFCB|nr:hypothetical protein [Marinoscillum pacificum]
MISKSKESVIAMILTLSFVLTAGVAVYYFRLNSYNQEELMGEKVKSEKMLSEKLVLAKEIAQLKEEIGGYKGKSSSLDKKLAELETSLKTKEKQLQAAGRNQDMASNEYKKQLAELKTIRDQLKEELMRQSDQMASLQKENSTLKDAIAMMEVSNEDLVTKNYVMSQIISENFSTEAHKKREKLTVNAKRTKEIKLGFDVPNGMSESLMFTITSPDGQLTSSNNSKTINYTFVDDFEFSDATATASIQSSIPSSNIQQKKHVVLTYKPENRLVRGIYHINIFSGDTFIGSSQIRLK